MLCNKKRIAHKQLVYRRFKRTLVLEAGLEPAQPQWPKDFKSFVSTIPPFEHPITGERKTRLELATLTLARLCSTN